MNFIGNTLSRRERKISDKSLVLFTLSIKEGFIR